MTVKELIDELSKFNPDAKLIIDNDEDILKANFSWGGDGGERSEEERDVEKEKKEAKYVTFELSRCNEKSKITENY